MAGGKKRLNEEAKRAANVLLNRCKLAPAGVELSRKLKPEIGARNNYVASLVMVNEKVDRQVGKGRKRSEWTVDEFVDAMNQLPSILNNLTREVKKLQDVRK